MKNKKILIISYFANRKGCCPAEWMDDKVDSLIKLNHKLVIVSSIWSEKYEHENIKHFRVPSLSPRDFKEEINELKANNCFRLATYLWLPLVLLIGIPMDIAQKVLTSGLGGGKWSWTFTSFLAGLFALLTNRINLVLSTGGPASAHLSAVILTQLFRKSLISELQDPLSGEGIGRNSKSAKMLTQLEQYLIKKCKKVVYVTKQAAKEASKRFQDCSNIVAIYPGSRKVDTSSVENFSKFTLVHLGTLYSTRNFNNLIKAIDKLIEEKMINEEDIQLINRGDIYGEYLKEYETKSYFKRLDILPRSEAVKFAARANTLLLIQHNDPRSLTTIPYKTYDYLNTNRPILGLLNSPELDGLLKDQGHYSAVSNDYLDIAEKLLKVIKEDKKELVNANPICAIEQANELIEL